MAKTVLMELIEQYSELLTQAENNRSKYNRGSSGYEEWDTCAAYRKSFLDILNSKLPAEKQQMEDAWNDGEDSFIQPLPNCTFKQYYSQFTQEK